MTSKRKSGFTIMHLCASLAVMASLCATGCQVTVGGQTLPSAYWLKDDVQYFAKGSEFGLAREAAAMEQARGEEN